MFYSCFENRQTSFSPVLTLLSEPMSLDLDTEIPPEHQDTLIQIMAHCKKNTAVSSALINLPEDIQDYAVSVLAHTLERTVCLIQSSKLPDARDEMDALLNKIFAHGEKNQWILFFDEADALFGKRSEVKDSHDRFANDETGNLLKRLYRFNGLALFNFYDPRNVGILASVFTYQVLHRKAVT